MKKVLIIGMTRGVGGVETYICNLLKYIDKEKFQIDLLIFHDFNEKYAEIINENCTNVYKVKPIKDGFLKYFITIIDFYKKHDDYSIIHLNECTAKMFIYAFPAIFYKNTKIIVHSHNGADGSSLVHHTMRKIQNIFIDQQWACSMVAANWMFGARRLKKYRVKILHNGIDLQQYKYDEVTRLKYREVLEVCNKRVIGSVARFEEQKNHMFMLDIFSRYVRKHPDSILILVGEGSLKDNIIDRIKEMGIEEFVLFLGLREDVDRILQSFDVFLLPSLYEGLPFVGVEAQAVGLPIVASDTVSEELKLTDLVSMVSLNASLDEWVVKIDEMYEKSKKERGNKDYSKVLSQQGYDIVESIKHTEKLYLELSDQLS